MYKTFFLVGETIAHLTDVANLDHPESDGRITIFTDKTQVVKAARLLLSSVTKVLVLADRIVIKQIITSRNKVFSVFLFLKLICTVDNFVLHSLFFLLFLSSFPVNVCIYLFHL